MWNSRRLNAYLVQIIVSICGTQPMLKPLDYQKQNIHFFLLINIYSVLQSAVSTFPFSYAIYVVKSVFWPKIQLVGFQNSV